jgi:cytochrome P450
MHPSDPIAAVAHPDPYPYYTQLLTGPPIRLDASSGLWIAAHAASVEEAFAHPACRVRPLAEPVPNNLVGLPAGEVFGRLVRMNDGDRQRAGKRVIERALAAVPASRVAAMTRRIAGRSLPEAGDVEALNQWVYATPVSVVGALLGLSDEATDLHHVVGNGDDANGSLPALVGRFVACLSPLSTPAQRASANLAAMQLHAALASRLDSARDDDDGLLAVLRREAVVGAWTDRPALLANLVGLLSQTYEATAGLLGNCIVALASHEGLLHQMRARPQAWAGLVAETLRHDPPVQNTRRFLAEAAVIAGTDMPAGAAVLLVLAAANRDPALNAHPERFDIGRSDRRLFTFGRGTHACPGQATAATIVETALKCLFAVHGDAYLRSLAWRHRPSANGRLPHLLSTTAA